MSERMMLDPREKEIWSGRPESWVFGTKKGMPHWIVGIPFLTIAVMSTYKDFYRDPWEWSIAAWSISPLFILVGLSAVLSPFWYAYRAARTTYVLTDRRAIIDISGPFAKRVSFPLERIPFVELQPGPVAGHVIFHETTVKGGENGDSIRRDGFIAIDNAAEVEQLLREAIQRLRDEQSKVVA